MFKWIDASTFINIHMKISKENDHLMYKKM